MSLTDKLFSIFRKTPPISVSEEISNVLPAVVANENVTMVADKNVATTNEWPEWLLDEYLLRDEGVIFGLSESNAEEKTGIIRSFFAQQSAGIEQMLEQQNEKIGELNLWINQREDQIQAFETNIQQLKNQQFTDNHHLPRTLAGFLLALGMCVGNYFLIEETFKNTYQQSQWVALGVFLAGMFNLFGKISFLHEDGQPVKIWKKFLEEIGMPLAASTFVFVMATAKQPIGQAFALWAFVFFLFMFSGKLLLGNLTLLQGDWQVFSRRQQLRKDKIHKVEEWEDEIANHKQEIDKHRDEKQRILPRLTELSTELTRIQSQRDMLIKLFESEFQLARNLKKRLTKEQMTSVLRSERGT